MYVLKVHALRIFECLHYLQSVARPVVEYGLDVLCQSLKQWPHNRNRGWPIHSKYCRMGKAPARSDTA